MVNVYAQLLAPAKNVQLQCSASKDYDVCPTVVRGGKTRACDPLQAYTTAYFTGTASDYSYWWSDAARLPTTANCGRDLFTPSRGQTDRALLTGAELTSVSQDLSYVMQTLLLACSTDARYAIRGTNGMHTCVRADPTLPIWPREPSDSNRKRKRKLSCLQRTGGGARRLAEHYIESPFSSTPSTLFITRTPGIAPSTATTSTESHGSAPRTWTQTSATTRTASLSLPRGSVPSAPAVRASRATCGSAAYLDRARQRA